MVRRPSSHTSHLKIRGRASRHALPIALLYALAAIVWIVGSDQVVNHLTRDPQMILLIQTVKGAGFILGTTGLVYLLVYSRMTLLLESHDTLRDTHAHLQAIFEASPLAIFTLDPQGRIGLWNTAAQKMFGWSQEEVAGHNYPAVPEDQWPTYAELRRRVLTGEALRDHPARRLCKDGGVIDVSISTAPLYDPQGRIIDTMVLMADVTERNRAQNIERERDSLRTNARAMEQVLGVVGHELRTPLASLQAISEVLLTEKIDELDEREKLVRAINDETIRLSGMVTNMLEAARLDSGLARWQWSIVDAGVICRDTVEVMRPLLDPARVTISTDALAGCHIMKGDEDAIRRLLLNLTSNAQKNTSQGSIHIQARSMFDPHGRWTVLTVSDTGKGIPPAAVQDLGRAFALNQGTIGDSALHSGAGLGLAICRRIVAAHGGRMAVSSQPGKGTTFTVALRSDLAEPSLAMLEPHIIQQVADATALLA